MNRAIDHGAHARGGDATGVLRIDFPSYGEDEDLEHVPWEEWFDKFDRNDLAMVLQDRSPGSSAGVSIAGAPRRPIMAP